MHNTRPKIAESAINGKFTANSIGGIFRKFSSG